MGFLTDVLGARGLAGHYPCRHPDRSVWRASAFISLRVGPEGSAPLQHRTRKIAFFRLDLGLPCRSSQVCDGISSLAHTETASTISSFSPRPSSLPQLSSLQRPSLLLRPSLLRSSLYAP